MSPTAQTQRRARKIKSRYSRIKRANEPEISANVQEGAENHMPLRQDIKI